jgi:hypothetical protein
MLRKTSIAQRRLGNVQTPETKNDCPTWGVDDFSKLSHLKQSTVLVTNIWFDTGISEHRASARRSPGSWIPIPFAQFLLVDIPKHWIQATSSSDSRRPIRVAHVSLVVDMSVNRNRQQGNVFCWWLVSRMLKSLATYRCDKCTDLQVSNYSNGGQNTVKGM